MAQRRMFAKTIIDSDAFLDMPLSTQALYFHLGMRADDDGFVNNPLKIMRMINASKNDMDLLITKRFVLIFDSGVIVVTHWKIHNFIRSDRYKPTMYQDLKRRLTTTENGAYSIISDATDFGIPSDNQTTYHLDTQDRLGKDRLAKTPYSPQKCDDEYFQSEHLTIETERMVKSVNRSNILDENELFGRFWAAYPRKSGKAEALKAFKKINPSEEIFQRMLSAINAEKNSRQWLKDDGQFIPMASKWLRQKRYDDENLSDTPSYDIDDFIKLSMDKLHSN
jgi:hypothetical protein